MKSRPDEKLIFELTTALSNRKKEITDFYMYIQGCQSSGIAEILNKSFILLLYAHWEGFIKEYTIKYFSFIISQKLVLSKLTENFLLIYLKSLLKTYKVDKNIFQEKKILDLVSKGSKFKIKIDEYFEKYTVGSESNLKFKNYKNICTILNYSLIDETNVFETNLEKLVHNRNSIAHTGLKAKENTYSDILDIEIMKNLIIGEMENFHSFIEKNIVNREYLASMHNA
ncbi:MAE_28990/MAE_18760 family HEPN-like nuclease [Leptotrichia massiliensis]|uniref:MAE_28990/MAE_18760 family HEPN-like nuclease n=1 Tax=Leptotrichia massiliensis TaxID=1852388 RepID=UPI0008D904C7|nr:MAE_28990/MAE_18760 family HEPN-like nuclease [Leptotrichia massiliensis]